MTSIKRYILYDHIYFVTSVTFNRNSILCDNSDLFWLSMKYTNERINFENLAWVILPDHFHLLIDVRKNNISEIMRIFKQKFSGLYRSKFNLKSGRLWQNRFWDHIIRDETDFNNHIDYIHYNPVKHKLTNNPFKYKLSSINDWRDKGLYEANWGVFEEKEFAGEFGE